MAVIRMVVRLVAVIALTAAGLVAVAVSASATPIPFTLIGQHRTVSGSAFAVDAKGRTDDAQAAEAPGYGRFDGDARAGATRSGAFSGGIAEQHSTLAGTALHGVGHVDGNASVSDPVVESAGGSGTSVFSVDFLAGRSVAVRLRGDLSTNHSSPGSAGVDVTLTGPDGVLFAATQDDPVDFVTMITRGRTYTLSVRGSASGTTFDDATFAAGQADYDVTLAVIPATRTFTALDQYRSLSVAASVRDAKGTTTNSDDGRAPDTAPWGVALDVAATRGATSAHATAQQKSTIDPTSLHAAVEVAGSGRVRTSRTSADTGASAEYEVHFFVGTTMAVRLHGTQSAFAASGSTADVGVVLEDQDGTAIYRSDPGQTEVDVTVTLVPGRRYHLDETTSVAGHAAGNLQTGSVHGAFDLALDVAT